MKTFGTYIFAAMWAWARPGSGCTVQIPSHPPADASPFVDRSFQGFAFEEASWPQYLMKSANDSSPNEFTINLMQAIVSRTGGHPIIRLGGTSAEYALYEPGQTYPAFPIAEINNHQVINGTFIGPSFFSLTQNLKCLNAKYIVQLPLAPNNISETIAWAEAAVTHIRWENIESLELGNEPNAFGKTKASATNESLGEPMFSNGLSNQTYAARFKQYADAVANALNLTGSQRRVFQCLDAAAELGGNIQYDVPALFEAGVDTENDVNAVAWHYYQVQSGNYSTLGRSLMNHSEIARRQNLFKPYISYLSTNHSGSADPLPFILDEVGNSLDGDQDFTFQTVLGSALWQVDWQLHAMSIGVKRSNWQQIMRAAYGMWLPRESGGFPAQVFANFYAMPFIGDFIGLSGETQVIELDLNGEEQQDGVVAYAAYDNSCLKRIAMVNFDVWDMPGANTTEGPGGVNGDGNAVRPATTVTLKGISSDKVKVSYLNSPNGAHANATTLTYCGSQWTAESNGKEVFGVRNDTEWYGVTDQQVDIAVQASSAVLVWLE